MKIINFDKENSLVSQYMLELRDVSIQRDRMRFRHNLQRIGEIMAYEISRSLDYEEVPTATPLGTATCRTIKDQLVLGTILRAGMPFHNGFLSYFDYADNAFVSAYRKYKEKDSFDIHIEYIATPSLDGSSDSLALKLSIFAGSASLAPTSKTKIPPQITNRMSCPCSFGGRGSFRFPVLPRRALRIF